MRIPGSLRRCQYSRDWSLLHVQDHPELPGLSPPPILHFCIRGPDVLVRVGHSRHLSGAGVNLWHKIIGDIMMSQADKWTGGNVTMVTSTDSVHLPMVVQVRWWMLSQTICRLYFGSFVRFITPSDSQTFPTSVFLSMVTAAISACPRQVKSGTILEDIN